MIGQHKRLFFRLPAAAVAAGILMFASLVPGCSTVDDSSFESLLPEDRELEKEIIERLQEDPVTALQGFGVRVEKGVATLSGSVPTDVVRLRALGVVRGTPGVVEVKDNLYLYRW